MPHLSLCHTPVIYERVVVAPCPPAPQLTSLHCLVGGAMPVGASLPTTLHHLSCLSLGPVFDASWVSSQQLPRLSKVTVVARAWPRAGQQPPCIDLSQLLPAPGQRLGRVHVGLLCEQSEGGLTAPAIDLGAAVVLPDAQSAAGAGCWEEVEVMGRGLQTLAVSIGAWMRVAARTLVVGSAGPGQLVVRLPAASPNEWLCQWADCHPGLSAITVTTRPGLEEDHLLFELTGSGGTIDAGALMAVAAEQGFQLATQDIVEGPALVLVQPGHAPRGGNSDDSGDDGNSGLTASSESESSSESEHSSDTESESSEPEVGSGGEA